MTVAEIRNGHPAARDVPVTQQQQILMAERIRQIWSYFVVSLGLAATIAWMALLGWVLYRAVLMLA
jgi:hypothetical protein